MNFKDTYRRLNDAVLPDRRLTDELLKRAGKQSRRHRPVRTLRIGYGAAAAIFCLCAGLFISMPVLAARLDPVHRFLYLLSPRAAQYLMPVQMSAEDQGIRMEVVSASVHGDTACIYITMEDLTGDRIDETTDLYDSYSIHRPFDAVGTCERAGYDAASGKVSFLITLKERSGEWEEHSIQGEKITFSVKEFLSRKFTCEDLSIPLALSDLPEEPRTKEADLRGCGGDFEAYGIDETARVLIPDTSVPVLPDDGVTLTGIGYVDGMLHIQTALEDTPENDNHGYLWLETDSKTCESVYTVSFLEETKDGHSVTYYEQVFDISPEQLTDASLHGRFVISGQKTKGCWKVTFPLE